MTVRFPDLSSGWEQSFLLTSDVHFDSIYCNRKLLKEHFDEAKKRNAMICVFGDWYDAMQGRADPRRSMDELRPEYRRDDYYDFVVDDSANWLEGYKDNLLIISPGNHETSVITHAGTDLTERLVHELRKRGSPVVKGGYGGWLRFLYHVYQTRSSMNVKYFHGAGSSAPVTKGVIQTNRQAVYLPDANVVVNGHNHQAYWVPLKRERISTKGQLFSDIQHHVRTPGYKDGYDDGSKGHAIINGMSPTPLGSCWMKLVAGRNNVLPEFTPMVV